MCLEDWQRSAYIPIQRSDETPPSSLCPRRGLPPPKPASKWRHPPPVATRHKRRLLDLLPRQTPYCFRAIAHSPIVSTSSVLCRHHARSVQSQAELQQLGMHSFFGLEAAGSWTDTGGCRSRPVSWRDILWRLPRRATGCDRIACRECFLERLLEKVVLLLCGCICPVMLVGSFYRSDHFNPLDA